MNKDSFSFIIYLIHELADKFNTTPSKIYGILKEYDCINSYLVPYYDVLHTMGTEYLMQDIRNYIENRGGVL